MIQKPLRSLAGQVVDRQGKPVANVEVFQSGDGPARTYAQTDAAGRFSLPGFHQGTSFLVARGDGFRFCGQLIKAGDRDVQVKLTRTTERPDREMKSLPDALPLDESRALARRLIEPYWNAAIARKDASAQALALRALAWADPLDALRKLNVAEFADPKRKHSLQRHIAECVAWTDPARAEAIAATIGDPAERAAALVTLADLLPDTEHDHKVKLIDAAAIPAVSADNRYARLFAMGEVGERYFELGEIEKAKTHFAAGALLAGQLTDKTDNRRSRFIARLARVDLPAALTFAREYPAPRVFGNLGSRTKVMLNIAGHLAADNPAETERIQRQVPISGTLQWLSPRVVWQMAKVDPGRARGLVEEVQKSASQTPLGIASPSLYLFLALGAKSRNQTMVDESIQEAIRGIDRQMRSGSPPLAATGIPLPVVEQIDPALAPEFFWRVVAGRHPVGDPYDNVDHQLADYVIPLARYDRDVAAAVFEPIRRRIERADDADLASWTREFVAWSLFDPRAAAARIDRVPLPKNLDVNAGSVAVRIAELIDGLNGSSARLRVAELLGMTREQRFRELTARGNFMQSLFDRDF
jgi:hypothetical protein